MCDIGDDRIGENLSSFLSVKQAFIMVFAIP